MSEQVIFYQGKVGHRCIDHGRERIVPIFCDNDIASPGCFLFEVFGLDVANAFVDGELHSIPRYGWVEYYVGIREFSVHAIQGFYKLEKKNRIG